MHIRRLLGILTAAVAAAALLAAPAQATPEENAPPAGLVGGDISNERLAQVLNLLERASRGRVDVRSVGTSNEGRPIHFATVGHGPVRILYITQQHGNEPLGTPAAVRALWTLGVPSTPWHRRLLSQVTLGVIVRANPDGHARNWRYNFDPDADPEFGQRGQGYDINRYHNPDMAPEDNPVPEAAAIQRTFRAMRPAIVIDYHMQGRFQFPDGRPITTSIFWPSVPTAPADAVTRSKQVTAFNYDVLTRAVGAGVSQYPGTDHPGIARNAYGTLGAASMLLELSSVDEAQEEFQITTAYVSMLATLVAAADGSLWRVDPARADQIPPRGPAVPDPAEAEHANEDDAA
ncbi:MAG TPA: M14 family zinc carboxypeptidase, partial [Actinophytocola sp.]|uniref:M14 family zinc carboxypeptidase n=1 Tax=Actinophytocola sp. TaxID=1872138 RepID=UPI002DDCEAC8